SAGAGTALAAPGGLDGRWTSTVGTIVLLVVAGVLAGLVTRVLRRADAAEARAAAREEVARRLHDGVLQTLAVVQRRSQDPDLVALAREQELDLRSYISDEDPSAAVLAPLATRAGGRGTDLVAALRQVLVESERVHGLRGELVVVEVPQQPGVDVVDALRGAVGECLTNVVKHAGASRCVVCLDVVDRLLVCTVNDDGDGFDVGATAEGTGLRRSVRGRLEQVGGTFRVRSQVSHGSEVELQVPLVRGAGVVPHPPG
ncbi:MAG: ATP-binding protein, partial [Actinomycetota bacterium]|nr:ATP-binding protein [Actinomycetota bacterium]